MEGVATAAGRGKVPGPIGWLVAYGGRKRVTLSEREEVPLDRDGGTV